MLKLLGFSASNYYNIAKLALLEKGLKFEEVLTWTGAGPDFQPDYLELSPMGKVPCLVTEDGPISESRCIVDYLDAAFPERPLYPEHPFARYRVQELTVLVDLYLELPVRRLLPFMFSGAPAPDALKAEIAQVTGKGVKALERRANFAGFLCGDAFSAADLAGAVHFPIISSVSGIALGRDVLADVPGLPDYLARMNERETVQKVRADSEENMPKFIAQIRSQYG